VALARTAAGWAGIVLSAAFWIVGQSRGEPYTGQSTDPNVAPLVVLLAVALLGCRQTTRSTTTAPATATQPDPAGTA